MIDFTGGNPFYLNTLCTHLAKSVKSKNINSVSFSTIIDVLEELLFEPYSVFNARFTNYLLKINNSFRITGPLIWVLLALASGINKPKDIAQHLKWKQSEVNSRLNRLMEMDILSKNGTFYILKDKVFSFWLKLVCGQKLNVLNPNMDAIRETFRKKLHKILKEYENSFQKNISDRVEELFSKFNNDYAKIGNHRFKLPKFNVIKRVSLEGERIKHGVIGYSDKQLIIIALRDGIVQEDDVVEFLSKCKHYRYKKSQRVLIALGGIENNAWHLARQNRLHTWNLKKLNTLMELYSKPGVHR